MTETVSLPLWLVIIGGAFAAWALLDRLLLPSVRWYFRILFAHSLLRRSFIFKGNLLLSSNNCKYAKDKNSCWLIAMFSLSF